MANKTTLLHFRGDSFMGVDKTMGVFIDFSKLKKGVGMVQLTGDQGTGKSSTLLGVAASMGAELGIKKERLVNSIDNDIYEEISAQKGDDTYIVELTASRMTVKKKFGDKFRKDDSASPGELIKDLFGPVGISPFDVKNKRGKEQITFFREMFGNEEGAAAKLKSIEDKIDEVFSARRDVNKEIKQIEGALESEPLFKDYERSLQRFKNQPSAQKEKKAFEEISAKNAEYVKAVDGVKSLKQRLSDKNDDIRELEERLAAAKKEAADIQGRINDGEKYLKENKDVPSQFERANSDWLNISKTLSEYDKWKDILKKEKELNERQQASIEATELIDRLRTDLLKATKKCLPKVDGLDIKVSAGSIDKTDEGVFYVVPGKEVAQPIHELSESEYMDMWVKIWLETGTQFVFIENITSFGSDVIKTLNDFSKYGVVFYTKMDLGQKEMEVSFLTKYSQK